jgi:3-deoxy-D-manno-octulosonate 8-phosphate phosphatase (KDO 8-P phosphatase)
MQLKGPEKLKKIQLLLLDVDGVLTDGRIIYSDAGSQIKEFNVRDGLGIKLVIAAGIKVGIVTGRKSGALHHRCRDLGIPYLYEGVRQKDQLLERIVEQTGVDADRAAFVADDIPDLCLMRRVGLSIAVADAHELVKKYANWITSAPGGCGAVREVCEALLKARGSWEKILADVEGVG